MTGDEALKIWGEWSRRRTDYLGYPTKSIVAVVCERLRRAALGLSAGDNYRSIRLDDSTPEIDRIEKAVLKLRRVSLPRRRKSMFFLVKLYYLKQKNISECAIILHANHKQVDNWLQSARKRLEIILEQ